MKQQMTEQPSRRQFLIGMPAASLVTQLRAASKDRPNPLLSKVRIGAEFFLNRTETRDSVFRHFRLMAGTGLSVVRIFTIWDHIEQEKGQWDFQRYDWIYDAAAQNGIQIANTLCSEDPPGWMHMAPFYHAWHDISDPRLRPYSEIYIEKVVSRYKNHPAHGVWLLQNEPHIRSADYEQPPVKAAFVRWLENRYGTVGKLNQLWYARLTRFSDAAEMEVPKRTGGWEDYPRLLDWCRFRGDYLVRQLRWIHDQIDKHDPGALTHINPAGLTSNMLASGVDMWKLRRTVYFVGASMHASWSFNMFPREDFGIAHAFCCDLARSVSAPAPWWVTEMQGGPTILTGSRPLTPTPDEITRWLWDSIGNGARAMIFWLWHPRTEGGEAGEWGLAGPNGEPTERTRAVRRLAGVLEKHEDFFGHAKPLPARTAILYDRDAMILYATDGWFRHGGEVINSLIGCHKALHRAHVPVDFLHTSQLEAGEASRYRVLYLPNCYALSARSAASIREFVRNGGTVWADGLIGWKDEQGTTKQFPPGPLSDVFGFTLEDIQAAWNPFSLTGTDEAAGELWRCLIPKGKGRPLLKGPGGRPVAVAHSFGKGRAIYYGTALTLGCLRHEDPRVVEWISVPAVEASRDLPVRLAGAPSRVTFHALQAPDRVAAVLNNWGEPGEARILFPASTRSAVEIISGKDLPLRRTGDQVEVTVSQQKGSSAVILAGV